MRAVAEAPAPLDAEVELPGLEFPGMAERVSTPMLAFEEEWHPPIPRTNKAKTKVRTILGERTGLIKTAEMN